MADENAPVARAPQSVRFFYIKGQHFRVVHMDGLIGGLTPRGMLHVSTYSERPAIPQTTEHDIGENGQLSGAIHQEGKVGIVRELDVDIIMSRTTAVELRDWLTDRIADIDKYITAAQPQAKTNPPRKS